MAKMSSRERVITALDHEEPDEVPIDIGGGCSTSLSVEEYEKLRQYLGVSGKLEKMDELARIARLDESVMQYLGSDCRPVVSKPPSNWKPPSSETETIVDPWGITWKQVHFTGGYYWEPVRNPLADATVDDLESYHWPDPEDAAYTAGLAEEAENLHKNTEYAIVGDSGYMALWETAFLMRGFDKMLMDMVRNPEFASAILSNILEINMAITGQFLDAVGSYIQVIRTRDDMATQNNLMFSPEIYRTMLKPLHKKFFDFIKSKTEAKIFFHSDGNVGLLIDDLTEIGVDIINPVQASALGDTRLLKARFGEKVVFWGGIDTQHVLPRGSAEDVETEVKHRIQDLAPGGGFVLATDHNIQPDVPSQNIMTMVKATKRFGVYPVR